jgi:hypothetical protein
MMTDNNKKNPQPNPRPNQQPTPPKERIQEGFDRGKLGANKGTVSETRPYNPNKPKR